MKWFIVAVYEDDAARYEDWEEAANWLVSDDGTLPAGLVAVMEVTPDGVGHFQNAQACEMWAKETAFARQRETQYPSAMAPGLYRY